MLASFVRFGGMFPGTADVDVGGRRPGCERVSRSQTSIAVSRAEKQGMSNDTLLGILVIVFLLILVLAIYVVYAYTAPLAVLDLPRYQYNGVLV